MQQRWAAAGRSFAAVKGAYFPQSTNTGLRPNREWVSPGRYRRRILAAPGIGGEIRQLEELSPSVRPTQCRGDRPCRARWVIQLVIAAIGIRLQDAGEAVKVPRGMLVPAVARGVIESCRRRATAKGVGRPAHNGMDGPRSDRRKIPCQTPAPMPFVACAYLPLAPLLIFSQT